MPDWINDRNAITPGAFILPEGFSRSTPMVRYFVTAQAMGWMGMIIVFITALGSARLRARRNLSWFSFCFSWILSTTSYLILSFAGQQTGLQPRSSVCLAQAALVYGAPSVTAMTTLLLTLQLWSTMVAVFQNSKDVKRPGEWLQTHMRPLSFAPYVLFLMVVIASAINGGKNPETVRRAGSSVYCIIDTGVPGKISAGLVMLTLFVTLIAEGMIANLLYRNWTTFGRKGDFLATVIRITAFTFVGFLAIIISLIFISDRDRGDLSNIFIALAPIAAVLIFGTQGDMVRVWMFWRWKREARDSKIVVSGGKQVTLV
ncbi:hypothetical protein BDV98DRAFT_559867 [Pterulicium gracile]|uniref:G-protein coupled receptors family 2 profile 2 domain-containing protein n=1 Tax=Pterulicium gracile TaxID=1884261 RepID=A0A5C3R0U8_9AGAR|nr:hypothetical protein BDV98DRAFT_559867 [Pterula gracilis]